MPLHETHQRHAIDFAQQALIAGNCRHRTTQGILLQGSQISSSEEQLSADSEAKSNKTSTTPYALGLMATLR